MAEPGVLVKTYRRRMVGDEIVEVRPGDVIAPELARALDLAPEVKTLPLPDRSTLPRGWPIAQRKETTE